MTVQSRRFSNVERLVEALDSLVPADIDCVSFDVFDTLVHRRAAPEMVHRHVARFAATACGITPERAQFLRDEAERELHAELRDEMLADDIHVETWFGRWASKLNPENQQMLQKLLLEEEMRCEREIVYPNTMMLGAVRRLSERGIGTVFVSDMYLGYGRVESLLSGAGYKDCFSRGYVSGDFARSKHTGRLFDLVTGDLGLRADRILHVGDNPHADYRMARRAGLNAFLIRDRAVERRRSALSVDAGRLLSDPAWAGVFAAGFAAPTRYDEIAPAEAIGRASLGPVFCAFAQGIAEKAVERNLDRVYFLSREGLLLKDIYETVGRRLYGAALPEAVYLAASRAPVLAANATGFGLRELSSIFPEGPAIHGRKPKGTVTKAFRHLGAADAVSAIACDYGFRGADEVFDPWTDVRFQKLVEDPRMILLMQEKAAVAHAGLIEHLKERRFLGARRVGVVDVGWSGQIQSGLERAVRDMPDAPEIHGFYMATKESADMRALAGSKIEGLVASEARGDFSGNTIFSFVDLFEAVARAPHGTVTGYEPDGTPLFAGDDAPGRAFEAENDALVAAFQKGIRAAANLHASAAHLGDFSAAALVPFALAATARLVRQPERWEAETIGRLRHLTNHWTGEILGFAGPSRARPWDLLRPEQRGTWREGWAMRAGGWPFQLLLVTLMAWRDRRREASMPVSWSVCAGPRPASSAENHPAGIDPLEIEAVASRVVPMDGEPAARREGLTPSGLLRLRISFLIWNAARRIAGRKPLRAAFPPLAPFMLREYPRTRKTVRAVRRFILSLVRKTVPAGREAA